VVGGSNGGYLSPLVIQYILVGYPCVATAHNNTHVNYPPKISQDFLLVVSTLRIIFFINARVP
jgi:hypothetical protein